MALHKICAGGKTPKHDHEGLEYTVVLKGSFSDENAVYREGDFLTAPARRCPPADGRTKWRVYLPVCALCTDCADQSLSDF